MDGFGGWCRGEDKAGRCGVKAGRSVERWIARLGRGRVIGPGVIPRILRREVGALGQRGGEALGGRRPRATCFSSLAGNALADENWKW